ncbi:hypothetical protein [Shewanella marisflavi]|uniref:hypothetical protein n=1 Tax=Shewanella marisflavi TaxID=260364 RepID=UPI003AAF9CF9
MRLSLADAAAIDAKIVSRIAQGKVSGAGRRFQTIESQINSTTSIHPALNSASDKPSKTKTKRTKKQSKMYEFVPEEQLNIHSIALAKLAANPLLKTGVKRDGVVIQRANHEHWLQVEAFNWLFEHWHEYYDDFAAVPNGGARPDATAQDLADEGVKKGYPDVTGDLPKGIYHGIFIEFKWGTNKPSTKQISMLRRKASRGYFVCVIYSLDECIDVLTKYFTLKDGESMDWSLHTELWER